VAGPIKVVPRIAFLPDAPGTNKHLDTRTFKVFHTESKNFNILEITGDKPSFEFQFERLTSYSFQIKITITGGSFDHHSTGLIKIKTDDPEHPIVKLPYRVAGHSHGEEEHGHDHGKEKDCDKEEHEDEYDGHDHDHDHDHDH